MSDVDFKQLNYKIKKLEQKSGSGTTAKIVCITINGLEGQESLVCIISIMCLCSENAYNNLKEEIRDNGYTSDLMDMFVTAVGANEIILLQMYDLEVHQGEDYYSCSFGGCSTYNNKPCLNVFIMSALSNNTAYVKLYPISSNYIASMSLSFVIDDLEETSIL